MAETVGFSPREGIDLAWRRLDGRGPAVVWLGGFASDMTGTKAQALAQWAERAGRAFLRFDYAGHGASGGHFEAGTITRWREDALHMIDREEGPLVLVGSSMGAWIACLAALARPERIAGLVLIAPAADFTDKLIEPRLPDSARRDLAEKGVWNPPPGRGYPITRALLEDGARWSILPGPIPIDAPVRVLQGEADDAVPWGHALAAAQAIRSPDLVFTLIRDGDHRLSRPQDIARLIAAVEDLV